MNRGRREAVPRDLATAAPGALWDVPVAIVLYAPTAADGTTVDFGITDYRGTVDSLRERVLRLVRLHKWMMEEGSRFRGYRDPRARPSLGYRCVRWETFLADIPPRDPRAAVGPPDYAEIVERVGGRDLVNRDGVKEFWIYHWHHGRISPIETNLASPVSPDISNSSRENDLPVYDRTYLVIGANFNRGPDKTVHNIGHQMEAVLGEMARRQDGTTRLFDLFTGVDARGKFQPGRCGNCHFPPNGTKDYDYFNRGPVLSDIEDWNPAGTGRRRAVSCETWERLPYRSPTGDAPRRPGTVLEDEAWWYLYWFQNFPGRDSGIAHPFGEMTNWWRYLGDWDGAIRESHGLWRPKDTPLRAGEIALFGTVREVRSGGGGGPVVVTVRGYETPGRGYEAVAPRDKEVALPADGTPAAAAARVAAGDVVRVIGPNAGVGRPLAARAIARMP